MAIGEERIEKEEVIYILKQAGQVRMAWEGPIWKGTIRVEKDSSSVNGVKKVLN